MKTSQKNARRHPQVSYGVGVANTFSLLYVKQHIFLPNCAPKMPKLMPALGIFSRRSWEVENFRIDLLGFMKFSVQPWKFYFILVVYLFASDHKR